MRSIEHLAGQLITTGIPGTELDAATRRALEDLAPSGVVLFGRNVADVEQVRDLTDALHALPSRPLVCSGRPTTIRSTSCSRASLATSASPLSVAAPSTTPSGRASVPVGSETATPVRAEP